MDTYSPTDEALLIYCEGMFPDQDLSNQELPNEEGTDPEGQEVFWGMEKIPLEE